MFQLSEKFNMSDNIIYFSRLLSHVSAEREIQHG